MAATMKADRTAQQAEFVTATIEQAAKRVRWNDVFTGVSLAVVLSLVYFATVMVLDRLLTLPDLARQLGFIAWLGALAFVVYGWIVVPMQRTVNPRYIARQVENTLDDPKNALINWVDLKEKPLPGAVQSAVSAKAAAGLDEADVEKATSSKLLTGLLLSAAILVGVLAVLFLVFKFTQFTSLFTRAVNPFGAGAIATQTQLELKAPPDGNASIIDGDPLTIAIQLSGRLPKPADADAPKLLVRYNAADTDYAELSLLPGETNGAYSLDVPRSTILNGFWYKLTAGDATTPEYRITVLTRPSLVGFVAQYEYPAYLKWPDSTGTTPNLRGHRGTNVAYTVEANRPLERATMTIRANGRVTTLVGKIDPAMPEFAAFNSKLWDEGLYTVSFLPKGESRESVSAEYPIQVTIDQAPVVELQKDGKPMKDEAVLSVPVDGLLSVDAKLTDDHGLVGAALHLALVKQDGVKIKAKPYRDGKPLLRGDGTHPTTLDDYKDSVKLSDLRDASDKPLTLAVGSELEYWVSATDNCTEPEANTGTSKRYKVKLTAKESDQQKQANQQKKDQERKADEQKNQQKQDDNLKQEKRPENEKKDPNQEQNRNPDDNNPEKKPDQGKPEKKENEPKQGENRTEKKNEQTGDGQGNDTKPNDDQQNKKEADDLQKRIDDKNKQAGDGKGSGDEAKGDATKPQAGTKGGTPPPDGKDDPAQPKEQKPDGASQPSSEKDGGKMTEPQRAEEKPAPKQNGKPEEQPAQPKGEGKPDKEQKAGETKPSPKEEQNPMTGEKKEGSSETKPGKNDTQPKEGDKQEKNPNEQSGSKPKADPERGSTKAGEKEKSGEKEQSKAGEGKPEQPQKPAEQKSGEKGAPPKDVAGEKPAPKPDEKPSEGKPQGSNKEQGNTKPSQTDKPKELTEEEKKEIRDAAKDLDSKDEAKKKAAQDKLDEKIGKQNREATEQMQKDLNSDDKATREAAQKKLDDFAKQNKDNKEKGEGKPKELTEEEKKEIRDAAKDLDSKDEAKKKAAQDKLDEKIGKQNREATEQMQKDLNSDDKATREAAQKKLDDFAKNNKGNEQPKDLTPEQKADLEKAAKDMNSKNKDEREAAEKKLDEMIGKEKREEIQNDLKDLQGNDSKKQEAAKEKLDKLAKEANSRKPGKPSEEDNNKLGGAGLDNDGSKLEANAANRLKSEELRLKNFKDVRGNKEFLKEAGYTPEQYEEFLKKQEAVVERLRDDVANAKPNTNTSGKPTQATNDFSGERLKTAKEGALLNGSGGPSIAAPGFADAQKRFAAEAAKREAERNKQK